MNPRKLSQKSHDDLLKSFQEFDYVELVAINQDGTILAGHQRVHIMQELGWHNREIEVRIPSYLLPEKQCKAYLIRSNKNTGEWDFEILANAFELEDLYDCGFEEKDFQLGDWNSDLDEGSNDPPEEPDIEIIKLQVPLGKRTEILPIIKISLQNYNVTIL